MVTPTNPPPRLAYAPHLCMPRGKAWRIDLAAIRSRVKPDPEQDAIIDAWLVEAAWAHPVWHSYLFTLIHLRPIDGVRPPFLQHPLATHELMVSALDSQGDRNRLLVEGAGPHCPTLTPPNYVGQFTEIEDELAMSRVREAVRLVCTGNVSPDTDFRHQWVGLFGPMQEAMQ